MSHDFEATTLVYATRKARQCFWCHEPLPVGSEAVKVAGKWEGDFSSIYMHQDCHAAWLRDPCNEEEGGCEYPHRRGKTCHETTDIEEGRHGKAL